MSRHSDIAELGQAMKAHAAEERRERVSQAGGTISAIQAAGATVRLVDPVSNHYRVTKQGEAFDFWLSTGRWLKARHTGKRDATTGGRGLGSFIARLDQIGGAS